jgi:hypothetical protein
MPKRKQTKFMLFALAIMLSWSSSTIYSTIEASQIQALNACMSIDSNLPLNHSNHPCQTSQLSNQSWWAWFKGDSRSAHFHFLDLVELLHRSALK